MSLVKRLVNLILPAYQRICTYGWCVRGQTYDYRCHRHQRIGAP